MAKNEPVEVKDPSPEALLKTIQEKEREIEELKKARKVDGSNAQKKTKVKKKATRKRGPHGHFLPGTEGEPIAEPEPEPEKPKPEPEPRDDEPSIRAGVYFRDDAD